VGLVAKGVRDGVMRGWLLQAGAFVPDREVEAPTSPAALLAAAVAGQETTYTLVPAGMARRLGIDRDGDTHLDRDELDAGSDPADAGSVPGACPADLSGDGIVDGADLGLLLSAWGLPGASDLSGDGITDGADLGVMLAAWGACGG
jgi:hypothetical protein